MRSQGTRRVAQAAGAAMVAVIALAGCSAGQVAETAILKAPVSGLNTQSPDGGLLIRNLQVVYNNPEGYPANSNAPIQISLFNQTEQAITVTIASRIPQDVTESVVSSQAVGVGAFASAEKPSAPSSSAADAPVLQPAKFTIEPLGSQTFLGTETQVLQAVGLSNQLRPGYSLALSIQVGSAAPLEVLAPFAIPTSPASRAPGIENENSEE
jgi:hypothetical protein